MIGRENKKEGKPHPHMRLKEEILEFLVSQLNLLRVLPLHNSVPNDHLVFRLVERREEEEIEFG